MLDEDQYPPESAESRESPEPQESHPPQEAQEQPGVEGSAPPGEEPRDQPGPGDALRGGAEAQPATAPATGRTARKTAAKKTTAKQTTAKKTTAKKTTATKTTAKRATTRRVTAQAAAEATSAEAPAADTTADATAAEAPAKATAQAPAKRAAKKTAAKKTAAKVTAAGRAGRSEPVGEPADAGTEPAGSAPADQPAAPRTAARRRTVAKAAAQPDAQPAAQPDAPPAAQPDAPPEGQTDAPPGAAEPPVRKASAKRGARKPAALPPEDVPRGPAPAEPDAEAEGDTTEAEAAASAAPPTVVTPLFQPPEPVAVTPAPPDTLPEPIPAPETGAPEGAEAGVAEPAAVAAPVEVGPAEAGPEAGPEAVPEGPGREEARAEEAGAEETGAEEAGAEEAGGEEAFADEGGGEGAGRRRRRRGGRRRRRGAASAEAEEEPAAEVSEPEEPGAGAAEEPAGAEGEGEAATSTRRRRRRRRSGEPEDRAEDDAQQTVTRVRKARKPEDEITALTGSTRLEAKKQRRREGREAGRRRAPVISEAEFLARREAVDRVMVIRQRGDLTQIAVLEDQVLVEHYVAREAQTSLIGNVYLGRVQNVLPSMEAAFIDIGKGRNAVLYAGEVNWEGMGANGGPRKIEAVLKPGQAVLVQVTKDPVGHKGARLTSQVSLPGRFLVYVPDGTTSGISRKLPDTERNRLKALLREIVPDTAGVIVRTAAEGASEEELTRDVERLTARWADIETKVAGGNAPQLLYGEPDLTLKVVRDLFTEDFARLVVSGDDAWETVRQYVDHVAPDLADRLERFEASEDEDAFTAYRIDEQIAKGLDRKVWLPSGGSLVFDRTEAMTVVDVNTGKFTGSGGNLEETVTKNNLEAAEEIVRQLRLRDIGGIVVVDFIDMVLESNRDLVLRRLVECLGRDRTRHQVAEVTSLGLVQMTRKRIGTGLLEAFSEPCEQCLGRGVVVHPEPVDSRRRPDEDRGRRGRGGRGGRRASEEAAPALPAPSVRVPTPADLAAMARHDDRHDDRHDELPAASLPAEPVERVEAASEPPAQPAAEPAEPVEPVEPVEPMEPVAEPAAESAAGPVQPVAERAGEPTAAPVVDVPLAEPDAEPLGVAGPVAAEPGAGLAPPSPSAPAAPRLVTTVRRRGAHRAAGPPSGVAVVQVDTAETSADTAETVEGAATVEPPEPTGLADPVDNDGGPGTGEAELVDQGWAHVPIKKKGSRKR